MQQTKYFCDRCGKEIKEHCIFNRRITYNFGEDFNFITRTYETEYLLCDDCHKKVYKFIKGKGESTSEK